MVNLKSMKNVSKSQYGGKRARINFSNDMNVNLRVRKSTKSPSFSLNATLEFDVTYNSFDGPREYTEDVDLSLVVRSPKKSVVRKNMVALVDRWVSRQR